MPASANTTSLPVFERLKGQDQVRRYLETAVREHRVSHAYLFVGPAGCGQEQAAMALAKALVCPKDGCNACEECIRVDRKSHPDVQWFEPEGAAGYVIEQIRTLIKEVALTPVRSDAKVYIIQSAETLTGACANALLKTIEEPPTGVVFILMARSLDAVLPTISSRCQCVPFRLTNQADAISQVALATGVTDKALVRIAFSITGTPDKATEFVKSLTRQEARRRMVRILGDLPRDDTWDIICAAKEITAESKAQTKSKAKAKDKDLSPEELAAQEQAEREADFLSPKALKLLEQRSKRKLTAQERSCMIENVAVVQSVLRDVLMYLSGAQSSIVNTDSQDVIERLASQADVAGVLKALKACDQAIVDLGHNVTLQLIFEVMLLHCKEALCPPLYR